MVKKVGFGVGKRKLAIAKANAHPGTGVVRINSMNLDSFSNEIFKLKISEPLRLAGDLSKKVDVDVKVEGGGWSSQTEASRMALARSLVDFFDSVELKKTFLDFDRHLLVADTRRTEPQKPCRSAARRQKQTSKR